MRKNIFSKKIQGGEKMDSIGKLILLPLMLLFVVGIAQATVTTTLNTPAAGARISGATYVLNCSATADDYADGTNLTQAEFLYGTTSIGTNTTEANATEWTLIWDSTAVADHIADITCTVTDSNSTTDDDVNADCIIDNTVPACIWVLPTGNEDEIEPGDTISVTLTGTTGEDATCTALTFGSNAIYTPTLATGGGSCSWSSDGEPPEGIYSTVSLTVSDGTNSTTCSVTDIIVQEDVNTPAINKQVQDLQTTAATAAAKASQNQVKNIALLALGIWLVWLVFFMKK